jgi:hypothetical protein
MVKLIVPAVGFSGVFPELVSAVDDLFLGGIFHFPAFKIGSTTPSAGCGRQGRASHTVHNGLANQFRLSEVVPNRIAIMRRRIATWDFAKVVPPPATRRLASAPHSRPGAIVLFSRGIESNCLVLKSMRACDLGDTAGAWKEGQSEAVQFYNRGDKVEAKTQT